MSSAAHDSEKALSADELQRYARHLALPSVGMEGQLRLRAARVLVIGAGGLGSPVALYLAAAGVGTIGLVDFDVVDISNLHRQILHGTADIGRPKLDSARDRLHDANPHVRVNTHAARLSSANAMEIITPYDVVVDGTDNFATRYLVNDACVLLGKPNVYGSIFRFEGQASVFSTGDAPCYRCLFAEPPPSDSIPNCAEGGVLGVLPGIVGCIQATETIKLLLGIGETLAGRLLLVDAMTMSFRNVRLRKDPECPACGTRSITSLIDYDAFCGVSSVPGIEVQEISPRDLARLLARGEVDLIDVREPDEWGRGHIEGARLIPLGQLDAEIPALDIGREIVVMCQSGGRSATASRKLLAAGHKTVRNLTGGMTRWQREIPDAVGR